MDDYETILSWLENQKRLLKDDLTAEEAHTVLCRLHKVAELVECFNAGVESE